jgi:hypothetical protein
MLTEAPANDTSVVYIDRLTRESVRRLLGAKIQRVIVLEKFDARQRRLSQALVRQSIEVVKADFFAGHLKNADGESVWLANRRKVSEIAFDVAREIVSSHSLLQSLNAKYQRDTLLLSLAKALVPEIEACTLRVTVAHALHKAAYPTVLLAAPRHFHARLLDKYFPGVRLDFYPGAHSSGWIKIKLLVWDFVRHLKRLLMTPGTKPSTRTVQGPSVLMVQEDVIRYDKSMRGQPHWLDARESVPQFTTYVANLRPLLSIAKDVDRFPPEAFSVIPACTLRKAWVGRRRCQALMDVEKDRRKVLAALLCERDTSMALALLHTSQLFMEAQRIGALAKYLNAHVFLTSELSSDPIQLVAGQLGVKTIAYQYSNLGVQSPLMMSTSDCYVIFSEMYKPLFCRDGIMPKDWLVGGYPYDGIANTVRHRAQSHRSKMRERGATFIVCYLDESVQHDRWGLVSKEDHLTELHVLVTAVLNDATFGLVIKSQFMKNTPRQLYPSDDLIRRAAETGRYLELQSGRHRNEIYPVEAALTADLCIGHKFGATAALESALAGVRTVLLDSYSSRTPWDSLYAQVNVEFKDINLLMEAISNYRLDCLGAGSLGDWKSILHHFDPHMDGQAIGRLRNEINRHLNENFSISQ